MFLKSLKIINFEFKMFLPRNFIKLQNTAVILIVFSNKRNLNNISVHY